MSRSSQDFLTFLVDLHDEDYFSKGRSLCFKSKEYPLLFFSLLLGWLRTRGVPFFTVDIKTQKREELQRSLETAFLGQTSTWWLGSLTELSNSEQSFWMSYVSKYQGPHTILFWVAEDTVSAQSQDTLILPSSLTPKLASAVSAFFNAEQGNTESFFKKVAQKIKEISLDHYCLLMQYKQVMGRNEDQLVEEILPLIITPQNSLFALSEAVLLRNKKAALHLWNIMQDTFPLHYWISFWSEQVWRAYWYAVLMRLGRIADAKKVAYRLPYAFMQKGWKGAKLERLQSVHNLLYETDRDLKNGWHPEGNGILDVICFQLMEE